MLTHIWREPTTFPNSPSILHLAEVKEDGGMGEPRSFNPRGNRQFCGWSYDDLNSFPDGIHTIPCPRPSDPIGRQDVHMPIAKIQYHLDGRAYVDFILSFADSREVVEFDAEDDEGATPALPTVQLEIRSEQKSSLCYLFRKPGCFANYPCEADDERRTHVVWDTDGGALSIKRGSGGYLKALEARLANPSITDEEREWVLSRPVHVFLDLAPPVVEQKVASPPVKDPDVLAPSIRVDAPEVIATRPHHIERSAVSLFPDGFDQFRNERVGSPKASTWTHEFVGSAHRNAKMPANRVKAWLSKPPPSFANHHSGGKRLLWDDPALDDFEFDRPLPRVSRPPRPILDDSELIGAGG